MLKILFAIYLFTAFGVAGALDYDEVQSIETESGRYESNTRN